MKNTIDSNFAIAILALVAACVGFSFWLYNSINSSRDSLSFAEESNHAKINVISANDQRASDHTNEQFVSYEMEKAKFSFKYPQNWGISQGRNGREIFFDSSGAVPKRSIWTRLVAFCSDPSEYSERFDTPQEVMDNIQFASEGIYDVDHEFTKGDGFIMRKTEMRPITAFPDNQEKAFLEQITYTYVSDDLHECKMSYSAVTEEQLQDFSEIRIFEAMAASAFFIN